MEHVVEQRVGAGLAKARFPNVSGLHLGELRRYWSPERRDYDGTYLYTDAAKYSGA